MKNIVFFPLLSALLVSTWASAETAAKLKCTSTGATAHTRCSLESPVQLGTLDENMEASWTVSYSFPCKGQPTALSFHTGSKHIGLEYTNESQPIMEFIEDGTGPLTFVDRNPVTTRRATLQGECSLRVHSVRVTPSIRTLGIWTENARTQAKIINLSQTLYELAADFRSYASWDNQQTTTILNASRLKIKLFESECENGDQTACRSAAHFRVVVGSLEAKLKGTPAQPIDEKTGEELADIYLKDMEDEVKIGREMINRFNRWSVAVTKELEDIINSIQI